MAGTLSLRAGAKSGQSGGGGLSPAWRSRRLGPNRVAKRACAVARPLAALVRLVSACPLPCSLARSRPTASGPSMVSRAFKALRVVARESL